MREQYANGVSKTRKFGVWVLEILGEAVGTTLVIQVLGIIEFYPLYHSVREELSARHLLELLGIGIYVLVAFALTGYLVTTLVSALFMPRKHRLLYPALSGGLYLLHSEMFLIWAGNKVFDTHHLPLQIAGAFVAFVATFMGDRLRGL